MLAAGLGGGALLRLFIAFTDQGLYWPDEVYQSLEPAHHLVFGYGLLPWEYREGARGWALPGLIALLMKAAALLGLPEPEGYLFLVRAAFVLASLGCCVGVERLARVCGADELPAATAAAACAVAAPSLYFAHRALSENASAPAVVVGLALVLDAAATRRRLVTGASLLGLAVLLRLHCAVFAAGALLVLVARRRWRRSLDVLLTLAVWAFLFGLLDRLTWSGWFQSVIGYLELSLGGGASAWGTAPWHYYLRHLVTSMGGLGAVVLACAALAALRAPGLAAVAGAFLALHSAVGHKELRFVIPDLPLLFALLGVGMSLLPLPRRGLALGVVGLAALLSAARTPTLTFGDLGSPRGQESAWDDPGSANRLLLRASRLDDLCGLRLETGMLAWTGGHSHLHRRVPIYDARTPRDSGFFNYVIAVRARGLRIVAHDGDLKLARLPVFGCLADPGYRWQVGQ